MEIKLVKIDKPEDMNFILGQSHFIKTVEDVYEACVNASPALKFGVAFCEASAKRLVRFDGNDEKLMDLAVRNAESIGCGHSFILFMEGGFPVNVLRAVKQVPEVCSIFCATANPTHVIVAENEQGRGIMGVIDGEPPLGVEGDEDKEWRRNFLRQIGYKR